MTGLRLTNRFFLVAAGLVGLSFFVAVVPGLGLALPGLWAVLAVLALVDFLPLRPKQGLRATLTYERLPELGLPLPLHLTVPLGEAAVEGALRVPAPAAPHLEMLAEDFELTLAEENGERFLRGHLTARAVKLGYARVEQLRLKARSRLGLWRRASLLPLERPCEYRVMPTRHEPPTSWLKENAAMVLAQSASRRRMRANEPDIFHSIREYNYGDSRRFLDAKKWARYGIPMTRTYEAEKQHHVVVALDVGQAMKGQIAGSEKLDYYLALALMILENALASGDTASFVSFSREAHVLLPRIRSRRDLDVLFRRDSGLEPRESLTDFHLLAPTLQRIAPRRSIVVLLTDFSRPSSHDPIREALTTVSRRHLTVAISLQDRAHSLDELVLSRPNHPLTESEASQLLYSAWMEEQLATFRAGLQRLGVPAVAVPEQYWLSAVTGLYTALRESTQA